MFVKKPLDLGFNLNSNAPTCIAGPEVVIISDLENGVNLIVRIK